MCRNNESFFRFQENVIDLVCGQAIDPIPGVNDGRRHANVQDDQESQAIG
jgi:hypothetical protein